MKDFHFDAIAAFENYEIEKMRDGHVVVTTKVWNPRSIIMEMRMEVISLLCVTKSVVWS